MALRSHLLQTALSLTLLALASAGCVNMSYLPTDEGTVYPPSDKVEVLWQAPERPYQVIGRVSASSSDYGEQELFKRIKARAVQEGAHAIIVGATDEDQSIVGTPTSSGGTMIIPVSHYRVEALAIRWVQP